MSYATGRGRSTLAMLAALVTGGGGGRMLASIVRSLCPERDPRPRREHAGHRGRRLVGLRPVPRRRAARRDWVHRPLRRAGLPGRAGGDLTAGRADIIVTTLDQYLLEHPEGTVVGIIDQSVGADALALGTAHHPELDSIDDVPALVAGRPRTATSRSWPTPATRHQRCCSTSWSTPPTSCV